MDCGRNGAFNDHLKGTIGADFFGGDDNTFYGRLKSSKTVFAELRSVSEISADWQEDAMMQNIVRNEAQSRSYSM